MESFLTYPNTGALLLAMFTAKCVLLPGTQTHQCGNALTGKVFLCMLAQYKFLDLLKELSMGPEINFCRRQFVRRSGFALAAFPLLLLTNPAKATTNAAARSALRYQSQPSGEKSCASCLQFDSGTTSTALGSCKLIPDDNEISPTGYCISWAAKA